LLCISAFELCSYAILVSILKKVRVDVAIAANFIAFFISFMQIANTFIDGKKVKKLENDYLATYSTSKE